MSPNGDPPLTRPSRYAASVRLRWYGSEWPEFALSGRRGAPYDASAPGLHGTFTHPSWGRGCPVRARALTPDSIGMCMTLQLGYAPCGVRRNVNIDTELRVSAGTAADRSAS
ncbi:hypothetical protein GCM10010293_05370 [Streptomyces griseoflavus]|nr:hypothetical protein GCM10010293_05370 [Streptomyces griseoflavus]